MLALGFDRRSYGLLSVKERAIYIVRDHLNGWFQALADYAKIKEMKNAQQRSKNHKTPTKAGRSQ